MHQWKRVDIGQLAQHKEFMLDTDICLAYKDTEGDHMPILSSTRNCCARINPNLVLKPGESEEVCGVTYTHSTPFSYLQKDACCRDTDGVFFQDCNDASKPNGFAIDHVIEFAQDEDAWLDAFIESWNHGTSLGQYNLKSLVY
mmetsp:Transcript_30466/g.46680  ORF Transcript_30466/g.46680 Transcript_30466/m.46680 type:complete len:143 (-) Transcript_30466:55-483(-)